MPKVLVGEGEKLHLENKELGVNIYTLLNAPLGSFRVATDNFTAYITSGATGNCQHATIAYANSILSDPKAKEILKYIYGHVTGKRMFLMDINNSYITYLKKIFPANLIRLEAPYTSSNGSLMTIFLVDIYELN